MKLVKWNSLLKLTLTLGLILGLGLMAGCGDDDDDNDITDPGGNIPGGTITFTLNGTPLNYSTSVSASNSGAVDDRVIGGTGTGNNQIIMLTFPKTVGTHTILLGSDASIMITDDTDVWGCVAGSIILATSTDTHLVGTFTGTFEDINQNTVLVTNGSFDVPLVLVQ